MIAVCTHESRHARGAKMARRLGAYIALDDGRYGSNANHDRAWRMAAQSWPWTLVLEDDAVLPHDFSRHARRALLNVPGDGAVSFYLGTSYPGHYQGRVKRALAQCDAEGASWLRCGVALHGVALALPTHHVADMLEAVADVDKPYDERLSVWLKDRGLPCWYTVPSLVDHEDEDHVLPASAWQPRKLPRKAHRFGVAEMNSAYVAL